jgi:hypothetical protein
MQLPKAMPSKKTRTPLYTYQNKAANYSAYTNILTEFAVKINRLSDPIHLMAQYI